MKDERYKEIMAQVGMPDSQSLLIALKQVVNEVGQKYTKENAELRAQLARCVGALEEIEYSDELAQCITKYALNGLPTTAALDAEILRCAKEQAKLGNIVTDKLAPYIIACGETCAAVRAREGYNK